MRAIGKSVVILTLLITAGSFTLFAQKPSAKSDREKEGLIGPVATVRIEATYFERENERLIESKRRLLKEVEFDRAGKLLYSQKKPVLGDTQLCDEKFKYDEKGREKEKYCLGDSKERVLEKYTYEEEDSYGNWTKRVTSVPDKSGQTFYNKLILYREIEYFK